ncbi:extracellular solute-binding protein [uncultured Pleomorphomonas sp.]|uniref:ABC transporter substrate-binding protein n=1 Tax=uncultured Pleomorphomonas sp. TaxID=442121 RepID=UPI002590EEFE|nr:extracellular solute-binding protein [uncultured Pleomorphomonas sp.]
MAAPKGELIVINWLAGSELAAMQTFEKAFTEKYPDVTIKEIPITWSGDARGAIRTTLMGGEKVDILINTWPSFRQELVENGMLRPLDETWAKYGWDEKLSKSWRDLGMVDGKVYGIPYNYGDRSGLWYRVDTLKAAGIDAPPANWADLLATFPKLKATGVTPYVVPGKFWAHAEVFETLLLRTAGVDASRKLGAHEMAWNSDIVKTVLRKWREMLEAGCCADVSTMLGTDWDNASDIVLKDAKGGFFLLGMWINNRAQDNYGLTPGVDYGLAQFPALGLGHDNDSSVDAKEFNAVTTGQNQEAADAFLDFALSAEGSAIFAKAGLASPSKATDTSLYGPVIKASNDVVAKADVVFVLGDRLPAELGDEYRIQLQKFLQDPGDANIDRITDALEAKAKELY